MGDIAWRQKDEAGAVGWWTKALALDPAHLPARHALLQHALARSRWPAVAEQAEAILRADPADARVRLALGVALRHQGKLDEALSAYDQAEKAAGGKLPEVHLARGILLARSKEQCEPALASLQRYVEVAGPVAAAEGPAGRLVRECTQRLAAGKAATAAPAAAAPAAGGGEAAAPPPVRRRPRRRPPPRQSAPARPTRADDLTAALEQGAAPAPTR